MSKYQEAKNKKAMFNRHLRQKNWDKLTKFQQLNLMFEFMFKELRK